MSKKGPQMEDDFVKSLRSAEDIDDLCLTEEDAIKKLEEAGLIGEIDKIEELTSEQELAKDAPTMEELFEFTKKERE